MPEGFSDSAVPATRGRRDPQVAARIAAAKGVGQPGEDDTNYDEQVASVEQDWEETEEAEPQLLMPGDRILARRGSNVQVDGFEHWFSMEAETHVHDDESADDAYSRVTYFVNQGVEDQIASAEDEIRAGNQRRREAERRRPITPRVNR